MEEFNVAESALATMEEFNLTEDALANIVGGARGAIASGQSTAAATGRDANFSSDANKREYPQMLANAYFFTLTKFWSSEIQLNSFEKLQHLVQTRWQDLEPMERRNFKEKAFLLMSDIADTCEDLAIKNQIVALIAAIVIREDLESLQELFPFLVSFSDKGPTQAELVAMMLKKLHDDIMVHTGDLPGYQHGLLLSRLIQSLPSILPLFSTLLERHSRAASLEEDRQQAEVAKQHEASVIATLNSVIVYAKWVALSDLDNYRIIRRCGLLLFSPNFRLLACEFFRTIIQRKRICDDSEFKSGSALRNIFQTLSYISKKLLHQSSGGVMDEHELKFAESLCEIMVSLGSSKLQCIASYRAIASLYLQQMLGYFQHFKFALHHGALPFWLMLMRTSVLRPKATAQSAGESSNIIDSEKDNIMILLHDDIFSAILDASFKRLVKKEKVLAGTTPFLGSLELWSDDLENKGNFSHYSGRLLELIRIISLIKPILAGAKVCERISSIIERILLSQNSDHDFALMEIMKLALKNMLSVFFDEQEEFRCEFSGAQSALCEIFAGLLNRVLSVGCFTGAEPAKLIGHYLCALTPFIKHIPYKLESVINQVFGFLFMLPCSVKDPACRGRSARIEICASLIQIAKAMGARIVPHMQSIAETIAHMQRERFLLLGEYYFLCESFLDMASTFGDIQQEQQVLLRLLEPLTWQWTQQDLQNYFFCEPLRLVRMLSITHITWSLFHIVTCFEKALNRSLRNGLAENTSLNPVASDLSWMLPPLLKLLQAMHSLWFPPVIQTLPEDIKAAMAISDAERSFLLREENPEGLKGLSLISASGSPKDMSSYAAPNETDIQNWLKEIRSIGYNVLGLSMTMGDAFFNYTDVNFVTLALVEDIQTMEFRHITELIHSVIIPLVKSCPSNEWDIWLVKLLKPLLLRCQHALSCSWSRLLHEGRAKLSDIHGIIASSDVKVEEMEEKLLLDLTRKTSSLLSVIASPELNTVPHCLDIPGFVSCMPLSSLKGLTAFETSSMVSFLLKHKDLASLALQMCLAAFTWPDSESVVKVSSFCTTLVLQCISTNDEALCRFVCRDLFSAIIRALELESNAIISAELAGLISDIFMYLSHRDPSPRQLLLSLPYITPADLAAYENIMRNTTSPEHQKQWIRHLLLTASGHKLKALAAYRSGNVLTNFSVKPRSFVDSSSSGFDENGCY